MWKSVCSVGSGGKWDAGQVEKNQTKTKTSVSNFQASLPGRLLHLHFTSLGATISLPEEIQQESEHKCAWCSAH